MNSNSLYGKRNSMASKDTGFTKKMKQTIPHVPDDLSEAGWWWLGLPRAEPAKRQVLSCDSRTIALD